MIFGAAYYEEYLPEDRLERDMEWMAEAGMNTIRIAESTWSVHEPRDGEFDFSHVTRVIEAAARHGLRVIVGTPTYAIPPWLAALDPEILGGNPYGPRQNMDITNPTYRRYAGRVIRELVSRTAGYSNVIGYQIDNETKHYGVHTPRVVAGFRDWLRRRFGTIQALNDAYGLYHWSNSAASFEELPDPAGAVNGSYACAFEEYRRGLAAEFLQWQSGLVSERKREDQFITHNFDFAWRFFGAPGQQEGYSYGVQPDINHYDAAKAVDVMGTDIYCPGADALTGQEIAFGGDSIRSLKKAPYLVLESQAQGFTGWLPYPGQLRLMALSHIASGARGVMYWHWHSIHNGIESYWKGILSHDGERGIVYDEVKQIGAELKRLTPELRGLKKRNRIALIVSPEALHALRYFPTDKDLSYNDVALRFYAALYALNLECDVLYDRETDWSAYNLLVFPQLYCCNEDLIGRVRAFVASGGTVLASCRSFVTDEHLKIRHDRQPHGLTDVFGMHYSCFTKETGCAWIELLDPDTAQVVKRCQNPYWEKYASVTRNAFGKGFAWYLGVIPEKELLEECLARSCADAGIPVPEFHWPLVCREAVAADGCKIRFFLNYSSQPRTICVGGMGSGTGKELLTGKSVSQGESLTLSDWGAAVMKEAAD